MSARSTPRSGTGQNYVLDVYFDQTVAADKDWTAIQALSEARPRFHRRLHTWSKAEGRQKIVPRCLTQAQRQRFHLAPEPPRWCITGPGLETETDPAKWQPKWPYHTDDWKQWLVANDAGQNPALPGQDSN